MLATLTPEQMDEWEAFDRLEPLGPRRLYDVLGRVGSAACAPWQTIDPNRFIPDPYGEHEPPPQTEEQQQAYCAQLEARVNAGF